MNDTKKPRFREFWIAQGDKRGQDFVAGPEETRLFAGIHVIEHSAYLNLKKEPLIGKCLNCDAEFELCNATAVDIIRDRDELQDCYDQACDSDNAWREKAEQQSALLDKAVSALHSIITTSHSWVITHETATIETPIHDKYRAVAEDALEEIKAGRKV